MHKQLIAEGTGYFVRSGGLSVLVGDNNFYVTTDRVYVNHHGTNWVMMCCHDPFRWVLTTGGRYFLVNVLDQGLLHFQVFEVLPEGAAPRNKLLLLAPLATLT